MLLILLSSDLNLFQGVAVSCEVGAAEPGGFDGTLRCQHGIHMERMLYVT